MRAATCTQPMHFIIMVLLGASINSVTGAIVGHRGVTRKVAPLRGTSNRTTQQIGGMKVVNVRLPEPMVHVHTDPEPLVIDMGFIAGMNPKDGNPWFRYKKVSEGGTADHAHFNGLTSTGVFKDDILEGHNKVRRSAGLLGLAWSDSLEKLADHRVKELAHEGCYIQHSDLDYRWYAAGFDYVGENLYKVINMEPTGVDIADAWYAEIDDYTYGNVGDTCVKQKCSARSSPPCVLGHFTQMMWEKSTHVGCAREECPNEPKRTFIAVCHYGPGGNHVGDDPFSGRIAGNLGFAQESCPIKSGARNAHASAHAALVMAVLSFISCSWS